MLIFFTTPSSTSNREAAAAHAQAGHREIDIKAGRLGEFGIAIGQEGQHAFAAGFLGPHRHDEGIIHRHHGDARNALGLEGFGLFQEAAGGVLWQSG